jgi:hypothetical protein
MAANGGKPNLAATGSSTDQPKDRAAANIERQTKRFAAKA